LIPYRDDRPKHAPVYQPPARISEAKKERRKLYNSIAWKRLRALKLAQDALCEKCLAAGKVVPGEHVHHVEKLSDRPDLALTLDNLQTLCAPCHNTLSSKGF